MKGLDVNEGRIPDDPSPDDVKGLLPSGLEPITFKDLDKPITSSGIIQTVEKLGMSYTEQPLVIYRQNKQGVPRRIDNVDMVAGYPQYGQGQEGVANLTSMASQLTQFRDEFMAEASSNEILFGMEEEDFKKISILRPRLPGRHLQPPISLDFQHKVIPEDFKILLSRVIKRYVSANTYLKTGKAAILDGTDAKDTSLGTPTFYTGDAYHAARVATMQCAPVPDYNRPSVEYISALENFGASIFPEPSMVYASYLSFRQGATNKDLPLFKFNGLGFEARRTAKSLYTRQRAVWAAPFYLNVLLTPLVLRMKSSRQNILGMWHDPQSEAKYIPRLQKQGKKSIEVDYSSYDTTISNDLMVYVYSELAAQGYSPWESSLMAQLTQLQGAITPSFTGATDTVSYFKGQVTLMSGLLTTSELGSIVSISIVLYCLSKQQPQLVEQWLNGSFVILVQSDDVLFTTDADIDVERFAESASKLGITAKVKFGSTFLKRFLPVGSFNKIAKPMSRNVQQTFGNEDDYSGKPDAILRLALASRTYGLDGHPMFTKFFPKLFDIYQAHFSYVRDIDDPEQWRKGICHLTDADVRAIEQYAITTSGDSVMTNLLERAAFDPSAANVINFLKARGLDLAFLLADQVTARREYTEALFSQPTPESMDTMLSFARWNQ